MMNYEEEMAHLFNLTAQLSEMWVGMLGIVTLTLPLTT
jgi:hypothetical protein